MEEQNSYECRNTFGAKLVNYTIESDGLRLSTEGNEDSRIAFKDINKIKLIRVTQKGILPNFLLCNIHTSQGDHIRIPSIHYDRGLSSTMKTKEFKSFLKILHEKIQSLPIEFVHGSLISKTIIISFASAPIALLASYIGYKLFDVVMWISIGLWVISAFLLFNIYRLFKNVSRKYQPKELPAKFR